MAFIGNAAVFMSRMCTSTFMPMRMRFAELGLRQHRCVERFGAQRDQPLRRAARLQDCHRLSRQVPLFEREQNRQLIGAAETDDADFLTGKIFGFADFLLRHKAERKRIERTRDHHQIRALRDCVDRRYRVDLSEVDAVADQRLDLSGRTGREN